MAIVESIVRTRDKKFNQLQALEDQKTTFKEFDRFEQSEPKTKKNVAQ
jgi:hypothetical protein